MITYTQSHRSWYAQYKYHPPPGNITQDHTVISPAVAPGCCGVGIGGLSIGVSVRVTRVSQLNNSHYHEQEQNNSVNLQHCKKFLVKSKQ